MPEFEFDPAKSAANLAKHDIDFTAGAVHLAGSAPHRGSGTHDR
ncbi:hypothetical protein [Mycobacterium sp. MFM001]|nr:hypothetical protein [Mycobacterium sp. MFM001]